MTTTLLERGTKPFIMVSMLAAAALTVTTAIDWPSLPWVSVVALVGSFLAARRFRAAVVVQGWLTLTYLVPGLLALGLGAFRYWDLTPWIAGLIGAMLATTDPTRWHLPEPWRAPLVAWVLVVAASWPVVWLRELDFVPSVVATAELVNNGDGAPPDLVHLWVYSVVLTHGLGLLWLDWLCATFPRRDVARFQRVVLTPLAVGWGLATLAAAYQSFVDVSFVNPGHWAVLRRASGTLMDANPFGMLAALWGAIGVALVLGRWRPSSGRSTVVLAGFAALVLAVSWYGVWVSGSRSALLAGGIVFIVVLRRMIPLAALAPRGRVAVAGLVVALLAGGALVATGSSMTGPWQRLAITLPTASVASVRAFGVELWGRNWYGTSAVRMIADSPVVGVGVGAFHVLVPDVAHQMGNGRLQPDNAQNWFRHQLAEFGVVGSLGWMIWVVLFLRLLVVGRPVDGAAAPAGIVRGALLALGLASLVGMPTQNTALALTFWTLVFWYMLLVEPCAARGVPRWIGGRAVWAGIWVLALAYVGGLGYVSWSDLRVPLRAQRADWDYSYGFYDPEPDGSGGEFRWAAGRAVAVVPVRDRWIELSAWTHHPDVREEPVELKVWLDGTLFLHTRREARESIARATRIPERQQRVLIETWVDRTWRPNDYGEEDTRILGPGVRWRFFDR